MAETKRQVAFNLAGLAALITALTTAIVALQGDGGQAEKTRASAFAVLQYRIQVLESYCLPPSPIRHPDSPVASRMPSGEAPVAADASIEAVPMAAAATEERGPEKAAESLGRIKGEILRKIRARRWISLDEIGQYVQESGEALTAEDF